MNLVKFAQWEFTWHAMVFGHIDGSSIGKFLKNNRPIVFTWLIFKEPISKTCVIKGDNLCVTGPTKNLHILNAEWALITVWSAVCLYLWEIYGLP